MNLPDGSEPPCLFALGGSRALGEAVAWRLGVPLGAHEARLFEDGEHKARPLENVRGRDIFVLSSLYGDGDETVHDKLCRLLFFIGALKDAAAERVIAVVPYLCYARKDRKTKARDPVTTRYVAALFEVVGTDGLVTIDVHNLSAFQNAFRCRTECLTAQGLFLEHFASRLHEEEVAVCSPDVGGIKRAEHFRQGLSRRLGRPVAGAFMEKQRSEGVVTGEAVVGDVAGRTVLILDDLIATGTTIGRAVAACRERGARRVLAVATHGLFVGEAAKMVADEALEQVVVTGTVPPFRLPEALVREKVVVLDAAPLLAEVVDRIHTGGSVVALFER